MNSKDRAYQVQMYALLEERRVAKISNAEMARRSKEIWTACYGNDDAPKRVQEKET
jgi:hypothetical protein